MSRKRRSINSPKPKPKAEIQKRKNPSREPSHTHTRSLTLRRLSKANINIAYPPLCASHSRESFSSIFHFSRRLSLRSALFSPFFFYFIKICVDDLDPYFYFYVHFFLIIILDLCFIFLGFWFLIIQLASFVSDLVGFCGFFGIIILVS